MMKIVDSDILIDRSEKIYSALEALKVVVFNLPPIDKINIDDINQMNAIIWAISALAEKNEEDIRKYFDY
ncbi:hypothetical protein [Enterococcus gilvus]|uniref:hypothetical protein n=1 Tax=Enterococcus gilvus TaxID=160453 RepID=UPI00290B6563|nr:hypothetical protein [Enterococcus gilvus]MDU5511617.1 hypothetical protein [Enterococcus gilvus]